MNRWKEISIVMPIYNSEKFLKRAIDSIVSQTAGVFELILIDDCSTDSSLEIALNYKNKFDFIKVISLKKNMGVSYARNLGFSHTKGNYIFFMDSDDYIDPNFFEIIYKNIRKKDFDVICFNYYFSRKKYETKNLIFCKEGEYNSKDFLPKIIRDISPHFFVWNKIFKKEIITQNSIIFENRYFEDIMFTSKFFYYSKNILVLKNAIYHYQKHSLSLTQFMSYEQLRIYLKSMEDLKNFLIENNLYKKNFLSYSFLVFRFFLSCFYRIPKMYISSKPDKNIFKFFSEVFMHVINLIGKS